MVTRNIVFLCARMNARFIKWRDRRVIFSPGKHNRTPAVHSIGHIETGHGNEPTHVAVVVVIAVPVQLRNKGGRDGAVREVGDSAALTGTKGLLPTITAFPNPFP